jgi:accessory colonization factor AcfC
MSNNKRRRVQTPKGRQVKVIKSGNPDYVRGMQDLRRSSATTPVPSGKTYSRTAKYRTDYRSEA